jgi:hypothetical protein
MKTARIFLSLITVILVGAGCSGSASLGTVSEINTHDESMQTIPFELGPFSATALLPRGWEENKETSRALFLYSPLQGDADTFRETINIGGEDLTGYDMTVGEYADVNVESAETNAGFQNFTLVSKTDRTIAGYPAQTVVFTAGVDGGEVLQFTQTYVVSKDYGWAITYTSPVGGNDELTDDVEAILASLSLS